MTTRPDARSRYSVFAGSSACQSEGLDSLMTSAIVGGFFAAPSAANTAPAQRQDNATAPATPSRRNFVLIALPFFERLFFCVARLGRKHAKTHHALDLHAIAADRQGHALAHVRSQLILEICAVVHGGAVELEHEIPGAKICFRGRRATEHRTDLDAAADSEFLRFVRGYIAELRTERQPVAHVVRRDERGARSPRFVRASGGHFRSELHAGLVVRRQNIDEGLVRSHTNAHALRPVACLRVGVRIAARADAYETLRDKLAFVGTNADAVD